MTVVAVMTVVFSFGVPRVVVDDVHDRPARRQRPGVEFIGVRWS
jgi:hypothetical protein